MALDDRLGRMLTEAADASSHEGLVLREVLVRGKKLRRTKVLAVTLVSLVALMAGAWAAFAVADLERDATRPVSPIPGSQCWKTETMSLPNDRLPTIKALGGTSGNNLWGVGSQVSPTGLSQPLIVHFDGTRWSVVKGAPVPAGDLTVLGVAGRKDVWAAGTRSRPDGSHIDPLVEHWDGVRWARVSAPPLPGDWRVYQSVDSIAIQPNGLVWLLAHYSPVSAVNGESVSRDVLFRWNGRSFQTAYDTNLVPATFGTGAFSKISFANNTLTAAGGRLRRFGEAARPAGALVARWDGVNWDFEQPPSGRNPITQLEPAGGVQWAVQGGTLTTSSTYSTQSSRVLVLSGNAWTQLGKLPRGLQLIELAVGASGTPYLAGETRGQTRFDLLNWKEHRWHEVALGHAESLRSERRHPLDAPRAVTLTDGSVVALLGQRVGTADKRLYLWSGCS